VTSSRDIIRELQDHGWRLVRVRGSHHQFKHAARPGTITVPHPSKDLNWKTERSIRKQAGLPLRDT
jgi:predicted RNA binding protein YcfA (HicA-like mRNA interferase family)